MAIILILFFLSLAGVIFMIGNKLILLKEGQLVAQENFPIEIPNLQEAKYIAIKHVKKHSYIILVESIRFSIKSSNFLKRMSKKIKDKINNIFRKHILKKAEEEIKTKEVSGFLKMISEYKQKIRKIKDKVIKEEKENF